MRAGTSALYLSDRRARRRQVALLVVALLAVFAATLCVGATSYQVYAPLEVLRCYGWSLQMLIDSVANPANVPLTNTQILEQEPHFYQIMERLGINGITALCGALLAVAGSVYQLAFRNPVAAPTMLGTASGVRVGLLAAVLLYGGNVSYFIWRCYLFGLAAALALLLVVFACGRLVAPRGRGVGIVDLLLVGTILSSLTGAVLAYVQDYVMTQAQYELYQRLSEALSVNIDPAAWIILLAAVLLAATPLFLSRFGLNVLSLTDDDARMLGMDANRRRLVSIALATLMMVVAQLLVGTVSMVCLVVPHVSRMLFGANFARQLPANALIGALLLVLCRGVCSVIPFVGDGLPLGTVVSLVTLPLFVWIVALQQAKWSVE